MKVSIKDDPTTVLAMKLLDKQQYKVQKIVCRYYAEEVRIFLWNFFLLGSFLVGRVVRFLLGSFFKMGIGDSFLM